MIYGIKVGCFLLVHQVGALQWTHLAPHRVTMEGLLGCCHSKVYISLKTAIRL